MSKFKHNKKRNTAFLYEVLVLELTKAAVLKDTDLQTTIKSIIKEGFKKGSVLAKEIRLYKSVYESSDMTQVEAEKILQEAKREYDALDKEALVQEQSKLFFKIRKALGTKVFSNFVPNYKSLASLSQIFNRDVTIKSRMLLENEVVAAMCGKKLLSETKMLPMDSLILKSFIKRFNEQYSTLHEEQKSLLSKYVTSFSDNGLSLKSFLNEEIFRLKTEVQKAFDLQDVKTDSKVSGMTKEVMGLLEGYSKKEITSEMISQVVKIQNLVREIQNNDSNS